MTGAIDPARCTPPLQPAEKGGWDLELRLDELTKPLDFAAIFGRQAPVELEIGFGSGIFLAEEAARRPAVNFLAIESARSEVMRAKDKWRRRGLLNTRAVNCDALYFLEVYAPDRCFDAVHILFSDPWFKKKHHKRRVFSPRLVPVLDRLLKVGGLLHVKTDVSDYYEVMIALLDEVPFLKKRTDHRLDIEPLEGDIVTNFQRKALEKGHPVHLLEYDRV